MWSADLYLENLYKACVSQHSTTYNADWQIGLKQQVRMSLGNFDDNQEPLNPVFLEKSDMGTYWRLRVEITTIDPLRMPIYLLIPKSKNNGKFPAAIAIHGHGYGSKEAVGLNPDYSKRTDKGYHKEFAVELVRKGLVVVVPELVGFGDRKLQVDQGKGLPIDNSCYMIASQLLLVGKTLPGLRVQECRRIIDYVQTLNYVDANRIGCMGISGGGLVAAFTSILDERLKATVISGYTNTFKGSIMDRRHCLDNYIPGILNYAEMPDLIGLIVPRALFIEAATRDYLFPLDQVSHAIEKLTSIYKEFGVDGALGSHIFEGGHEISGEESYDWLVRQLATE
jgi:dienelactone hydrolase